MYIPVFSSDTLVLNAWRSDAVITRQGPTEYAELLPYMTLGCAVLSGDEKHACEVTESQRINDRIAENTYGTATSIGGVNRLRAYELGRFYAGHSRTYAMEYRMNFSEHEKLINLGVLGGLRTNLQLAFFYEQGTVNDDTSKLNESMKHSTGVGFRALISGMVLRLDFAQGDEGMKTVLFLEYPLQVNPLSE